MTIAWALSRPTCRRPGRRAALRWCAHLPDDVLHLLQGCLGWADHDVDAVTEHRQLRVGDQDGDLDQRVKTRSSPVISQWIQTIRSCDRSPGVGCRFSSFLSFFLFFSFLQDTAVTLRARVGTRQC
ncbi:MAG: hypothetical protein IPG94_12670 [Kineosporiaceae bacterium]|nr:hypothetical protein [Kineosporiaceae bacterium]